MAAIIDWDCSIAIKACRSSKSLFAVHESGSGPSRHFACAQQSGRFQVKAGIKWQAGLADSVEK
jgi:hypothetical protein